MTQKHFSTRTRYLINILGIAFIWLILDVLAGMGWITKYWNGVLIAVGIHMILAISLNIPVGYLGQLPLGHAGFMAVGAYTTGIFLKSGTIAALMKSGGTFTTLACVVAALLLGSLVSGFIGLLIGIPALRLRGDYLAIITLGFGEIIRVIFNNIDNVLGFKLTYGSSGLKRIPKFTTIEVIFIALIFTCYLVHVLMHSRHGRAILSIRENEIAAESVGIPTTFYKTYAFVFSAMLAGLAGGLYAGYLGSLYPSTFGFMKSIEILVMVVLGGMGSMVGSILSAGTYTILQELLRSVDEYRMLAFAILLILMMIFRPKGLLGNYEFSLSRILERIFYGKTKSYSSQESPAENASAETKGDQK